MMVLCAGALFLVIVVGSGCSAFRIAEPRRFAPFTVQYAVKDDSSSLQSNRSLDRRRFGVQVVAQLLGAGSSMLLRDTANAKGPSEELDDKAKLVKGRQRLNYLLDHWVEETTVCGQNDNPYVSINGCERTPLKVMDYMGYKSMKDPLFKAEKTMRRLEGLVPTGRESDYLEATEKWAEAAEEASGMAYGTTGFVKHMLAIVDSRNRFHYSLELG